jgi:hypothetical protein
MASKGPLRDIRNLALKRLGELETGDEVVNDDLSFAIQHANDMVEDWWSKYGSSLNTVTKHRHSKMEISVAKNTQSD